MGRSPSPIRGSSIRGTASRFRIAGAIACAAALSGCTLFARQTLGPIAATGVVLGTTPTQEIEQTFYVGLLDPLEQVPPSVYRVRVHGQASFLSNTRFQSGWVPAALIDSLGSRVDLAMTDGKVTAAAADANLNTLLAAEARVVAFGPEGFRIVPRDQRLVVVMGTSPEAFFAAVDQTLGAVAGEKQAKERAESSGAFRELLARCEADAAWERAQLDALEGRQRIARAAAGDAQ